MHSLCFVVYDKAVSCWLTTNKKAGAVLIDQGFVIHRSTAQRSNRGPRPPPPLTSGTLYVDNVVLASAWLIVVSVLGSGWCALLPGREFASESNPIGWCQDEDSNRSWIIVVDIP
jgi:hypothetical protein